MTGRTIAHYELVAKIGEGGMGVVYKARDRRLGRFVAVKILSESWVFDRQQKQRFLQEARLASGLNHPNIVTIHDLLEEGGRSAIVMEYVAGRRLDELIRSGALRLPEALKYAVQIAGALAAAHAAGIVHRDLKPGNVIVTESGLVKVLDFGLAKLLATAVSGEEPTTPGLAPTEQGTILGTVPYMSPEQVQGRPADTRSDIFSFGAVLYEMVTGRRAFGGNSRLDQMEAILRCQPRPVPELAAGVPPEVERVIRHCLRRDASRRFQHMSEIKELLEEIREDSDSGRFAPVGAPRARWKRWLWGAVTAVLALAAAGVALRVGRPPPRPQYTLRQLTRDAGLTLQPAISRDGKLVAYVSDRGEAGNPDIWVQQVSGGNPIRLTSSPAVDCQPVFSPSGSTIAFSSFGDQPGVYVMPALGGPARLVGPGGMWPSYSPDGEWLAYSVGFRWRRSEIWTVNLSGGERKAVATDLPWAYAPSWSPDGVTLLVEGSRQATPVAAETLDWWLAPVAGGHSIPTGLRPFLVSREIRPVADVSPAHDSRLVWEPGRPNLVLAAQHGGSADLWRLRIEPPSARIGGDVQQLTAGVGAVRQPSVDEAGRIVFASVRSARHLWRLPLDANRGRVRGPLEPVTEGAADSLAPSISADGRRLVFMSNRSGSDEIWERDLVTGADRQLTAAPGWEYRPLLSPDGRRLAFCRGASGLGSLVVLDLATGAEQVLVANVNSLTNWSAGGERLYFATAAPPALRAVDLATGRVTDVVRHRRYAVRPGRLSPDGAWISFRLVTEGDNQPIFVARLRNGAALEEREWVRVADGPNDECWWSPGGGLLYFLTRRDGFRCLWAQKLAAGARRPEGAAFPVLHLHGGRHAVGGLSFGDAITSDGLYCGLREMQSNIWMAVPDQSVVQSRRRGSLSWACDGPAGHHRGPAAGHREAE